MAGNKQGSGHARRIVGRQAHAVPADPEGDGTSRRLNRPWLRRLRRCRAPAGDEPEPVALASHRPLLGILPNPGP